MLELIASLVVDLSDQKLTVLDSNQQVVRVIPVSTGKASTPTPIGQSQVFTKYRSTTMVGRTYTVPAVPYTMCVTANEAICLHAAPWQEQAGQSFGVPRSHGCVRMPTEDARWLFHNTRRGTPITIQA
jgi:lipoprotein-anchoring transpeptidase ErfK/SrfK